MSGFILGWEQPEESGFGFTRHTAAPKGDLIVDDGDGHILTIAGTGGGKSRGIAIPNLLHWEGPAIVLDIKGELTATTARWRREALGQEIVVLDPWQKTGLPPDALNPLSLLDAGPSLADDCYLLASMFGGQRNLSEPFWEERAEALIAGLLSFITTDAENKDRSLDRLFTSLHGDDVIYKTAVLLDKQGKSMPPFAYQQLAALCATADKTREGIVSTAQSLVRVLAGDLVQSATDRTSFDAEKVTDGAPLTIYIVVPPENLESHRSLIRLWISALMSLITRRKAAPAMPTLMLLDEVAQLGPMQQVQSAITLTRSYGVRVALFLQSYSQLVRLYPLDHRVILENCDTFITMGHKFRGVSAGVAEALGDISAETLFAMKRDEAAVKTPFRDTRVVRRLDYLTDLMFAGSFDSNPMFANKALRSVDGSAGVAAIVPRKAGQAR